MRLHTLGSSSRGNGYILESDNEALIIEAGVNPSLTKKALKFNTSKIVGVLVSHSHGDHSNYISNYMDAAIDVYSSEDVFKKSGLLQAFRSNIIQSKKKYKIGGFSIMPFDVRHDVPTFGFLISHEETGVILFATDTYMIDYRFLGLSHIMIECNYADDIIERNIDAGNVHPATRQRVLRSHMELQTTKQFLHETDLSKVVNIVLIHLSSDNADSERFIQEVGQVAYRPVVVASKGLVLEFNKNPY